MSTTTAFYGITMWVPAALVAHFAFGWLGALIILRGPLGKYPLTHTTGKPKKLDWMMAAILVVAGLWGWFAFLLNYFTYRSHWNISLRTYRHRALLQTALAKLNQERT